jgi:Fe-S-cluster containining protein
MTVADAPRERAFSYACNACGHCCHDKRITLSPYEIARLAEATGATTRAVLERHTDEGGTVLRFDAHGCTFLDGTRCRAHGGRPLACRLYPIGRVVTADGIEAFVDVTPHPESAGVYGKDGTVASWIEAQGAAPYIDAAARYGALARRLFERLNEAEGGAEAFREVVSTPTTVASDWLDVDAVVERACAERGEAVPRDLEARIAIHLAALEAWIG